MDISDVLLQKQLNVYGAPYTFSPFCNKTSDMRISDCPISVL